MAIDGGLRDSLVAGTTLVARYKKQEHFAEVVAGEDGKLRYRLADGREFKSPSAAGSAVMGGQACNGWRFWSVAGEAQAETPTKPAARKATAKGKGKSGAKPRAAAKEPSGKKPHAAKPAPVEKANAPATEDTPSD